MTLVTRITRLFKADVHGILDWLEEPETVLKQAVRDMEGEIERGEQILEKLTQKEERLKAFTDNLQTNICEFEDQIDLCFSEESYDLARAFVRKKLEAENRMKAVSRTAAEVSSEKESRKQKLSEQKEQLGAIVEKMQLFVDTRSHASAEERSDSFEGAIKGVSEEAVELAFLNEKRKRSGAEAQA